MSRKKKKQTKQVSNQTNMQTAIVIPDNFDYQKFADAMIEAQKRAKEIEKCEAEKEIQEKQVEWEKFLGYKNPPQSANRIVKNFYSIINGVKIFWKIMTIKKDEAKFDTATAALLHISIGAMLWIIKVVLYFIAICFAVSSVYSFSEESFIPFNFICLLWSFIPFILARIVRMAQFEVDQIKDKNYLIGILSSMAAFIALILAIIK